MDQRCEIGEESGVFREWGGVIAWTSVWGRDFCILRLSRPSVCIVLLHLHGVVGKKHRAGTDGRRERRSDRKRKCHSFDTHDGSYRESQFDKARLCHTMHSSLSSHHIVINSHRTQRIPSRAIPTHRRIHFLLRRLPPNRTFSHADLRLISRIRHPFPIPQRQIR